MNLVWFRNDLRINDNPALTNASSNKELPIAAVYLYCRKQMLCYGIGSNQHALILSQLNKLCTSLNKLNIPLIVIDCELFSNSADMLAMLCEELHVSSLYFNVEYPVDERKRDKQVVERLIDKVKCNRFIADSLVPPWLTINGQNQGYKVFSAFQKKHQNILLDMGLSKTNKVIKHPIENFQRSNQHTYKNRRLFGKLISTIPKFLPTINSLPDISELNVVKHLTEFCSGRIVDYSNKRDFPSLKGTSEISAALAVGSISTSQCYAIATSHQGDSAKIWTRQLAWRDFYRSVMWHFPHVSKGHAFNSVEKKINWSNKQEDIQRFKSAETGIPIIDAAIRQLLNTGWMHNRLRMIVACYLTKNLWIDWRIGEAFFAEHLFDYDFANNNGGWQWSASVGTDAAPYFRVFNPQSQQLKFDKNAEFIKQWLPILQGYPAKAIHQFEQHQLTNFPRPQVDLKSSRKLAIESFKSAKSLKIK